MSEIRTRRRLAAAVALVATAALATGCSYLGSGGSSGGGDTTTLKIFVHSNPPTDEGFKKINDAFEKANPGVKVEMTTAKGQDFFTVRNTRLTAKDVDITEGSSSGGTQVLPAWVKGQEQNDWVKGLAAGNWVDLTDQSFLKNFSDGIMKQYAYNGKQYAVPTGTSYITGVFYNKDMFAKYGLDVPKTWGDFTHVMSVLKSNNVNPFIMGGKDSWPAGAPVYGLVQSLWPQPVKLDQDLWEGKASLTDPKVVELLNKVKTIYDNTAPNWEGIDYSSIPSRFVQGEAAMLPDGAWQIPAIQTADPNFKFGYFPLPGSDNAADNKYIASKLEFSLSIPTSSKHQEVAKKWLAFYSDPKNYDAFIANSGFGPAQAGAKVPAVVQDIQQYMPPSGFTPSWDQIFHPNRDSGPLAAIPFAYSSIAPLGTESDMGVLSQQMENDWKAGLH